MLSHGNCHPLFSLLLGYFLWKCDEIHALREPSHHFPSIPNILIFSVCIEHLDIFLLSVLNPVSQECFSN